MFTFQFLLTALGVVIVPGASVVYSLGLGQGRRASLRAALPGRRAVERA
jgi:threonine/homoserine/homoserine lactone efflux protein